jgi:hypothetical protein
MRSSAAPAVLLACLCASPFARAELPVPATVVERILAVVEGTPILLSEVTLLERLRGVPWQQALEAVIDERLMFREAVRLSQTALSAEEAEEAFLQLRANARGAGTDAELRRLARRQAAILKYVDFRFRPQVRIDDEAVRREWESAHPADAPPSAAEGEAIERQLVARELDAKIEAWVKELRAGAEVRYNPEPSAR